jgi:DeoR/GlpR family transcriptional regulator of sugar metabolism
MTGPIAEATLSRFYADICVLGAAGIDPAIGVTELDYEAASIHRLMIERSRQVMLLADHSKLGFRAAAVVAPARMVHCLITDDAAPTDILTQLQSCGIEITLVGDQASSLVTRE